MLLHAWLFRRMRTEDRQWQKMLLKSHLIGLIQYIKSRLLLNFILQFSFENTRSPCKVRWKVSFSSRFTSIFYDSTRFGKCQLLTFDSSIWPGIINEFAERKKSARRWNAIDLLNQGDFHTLVTYEVEIELLYAYKSAYPQLTNCIDLMTCEIYARKKT